MTGRFRYGADPLCLGSWMAYGLIRFALKPLFAAVWLSSWAADFFMIPAGLPLYLWAERRLGLRRHDDSPRWIEAGLALIVWSVMAEGIGPRLFARATGDAWDVVAYAAGGIAAMALWKRRQPRRRAASFDGIARFYDAIEWIGGRATHRARTAFLDRLPEHGKILTVGEGTGRWLCEWLRRAPSAEVVCVEASAKMAARARQRLRRSGIDSSRIKWIIADVREWRAGDGLGQFDAVVTHFFLDCFTPADVRAVVDRLGAAAAPQAVWTIADFQIPDDGGWRRMRARLLLPLLYAFFRFTTRIEGRRLTDPSAALEAAGFRLQTRQRFDAAFIRSDFWIRSPDGLAGEVAEKGTAS